MTRRSNKNWSDAPCNLACRLPRWPCSMESTPIGRRNWLFADTVAGANASANLYSLLQTCAVNGVDGYQYLRALLVALPAAQTADDYAALLPWAIALPVD